MKKILLIATGGTIASKPTQAGLTPQITPEEILSYIPEAAQLCEVSTCQLFNLDSTNVKYLHWSKLAQYIHEQYENYDGFVITHGTDTMAYSAAALSYMIQNSRKPIVFTGAQKSISEVDTDARNNLLNALIYASDDKACGVHIVFNNRVILGTRARKIRTKSFDAFDSIDYPEIAIFRDHHLIYYIEDKIEQASPDFYPIFDPKVFVLKLIPGISADIFDYLREHYNAVIVESFGVGGIPGYDDADFMQAIQRFLDAGKTLVMATQVPHEGSDMEVYQVGYKLKEKFDLIEAYTMTLEATVTKMMWILGRTNDREEINKMFYTSIQKDILF